MRHICMYLHQMYVYVCIYKCMYISNVCMYMYIHQIIHIRMYIHQTGLHIQMYVYIKCMYVYVYTSNHTYTYVYTTNHTYTYVYTSNRSTETCSERVLWRMLCSSPPILTPAPKVFFLFYEKKKKNNCGECHVRAHQPLLLLQRYFILLFLMEIFFLRKAICVCVSYLSPPT